MQEKVRQWLDEKIAKENKAHEKEKDELALRLNLFDETKPVKYVANYNNRELTKEQYENEITKGYDVSRIASPLKLTDEEYEEIVKHLQHEEPNKYANMEENLERIEHHTHVVSTIMIIYVILSIILGVYLANLFN